MQELFHLPDFLAEAFRFHVHHYQCLAVLIFMYDSQGTISIIFVNVQLDGGPDIGLTSLTV